MSVQGFEVELPAPSRASELVVGLIGDYDRVSTLHHATRDALDLAGFELGVPVAPRWLATTRLAHDLSDLHDVDAVLCTSGRYRSVTGASNALGFARRSGLPTLGTCGGCQHTVVEYARRVLGLEDAYHPRYERRGWGDAVLAELPNPRVGETGTVELSSLSRARRAYATERVSELYHCRYGVNPRYEAELGHAGLQVVGRDVRDRTPRILESRSHPYYVAALFLPQARPTSMGPHPLIMQLLAHADARR